MEKIRAFIATVGILIIVMAFFGNAHAQDIDTDSTYIDTTDISIDDIFETIEPDSTGADAFDDSLMTIHGSMVDSLTKEDTTFTPVFGEYYSRDNISKGVGDDIKVTPNVIINRPGMTGSPQLPLYYLNVSGPEITVNGLPYLYTGIYRPFVMGTDLNTIPWEIFQGVENRPWVNHNNSLSFTLGKPADQYSRSDIEVARGGYGYNSSRWRFFRPMFRDGYAYFTVGFKKSDGYLLNTDYDSYHVTGGFEKVILGGQLEIDTWKHIAKMGQSSFDYKPLQLHRQSRGVRRYELKYSRKLLPNINYFIKGLYHRSAQTITGYDIENKSKNDISGGELDISTKAGNFSGNFGGDYYTVNLYGLDGVMPSYDKYSLFHVNKGKIGNLTSDIKLCYDWNSIDKGKFLTSATSEYSILSVVSPFVSYVKSRDLPDLYLLHFPDNITGLNVGDVLSSYRFEPNRDLVSPVSEIVSVGIDLTFSGLAVKVTTSQKKISNQIYISHSKDSLGNAEAHPINIDDEYIEISSSLITTVGPFTCQLSGSYRDWKNDFYSDGLEKGPAATGFARLTAGRNFFIPDLYLGGSLEMTASSRRDYRSIDIGLTDGFVVLNGRLEFTYQDFTFWLNEENISNQLYYTWWPYQESPRVIWWGFRWNFYD